ncbi:hypothetical protein [Vallitalea guaymasensis]|uniref:hypothetical protein n=1 Tax=Vallitalea guaymasensis TaxID=1185412 RepID=UPI000DE21A86|nr:hypothetical protein [Vallitalea guaymasensis]
MNNLQRIDINMSLNRKDAIALYNDISYLEEIAHNDILPFQYNTNMKFSDDVWDFSHYRKVNVNKSCLRLRFTNVAEELERELKKYILDLIIQNRVKIITLNRKLAIIKNFLSFIGDVHIYYYQDITIDILNAYIEYKTISLSYKYSTMRELLSFFEFLERQSISFLSKELKEICKGINQKLILARRGERKTPNIPSKYFDNLLASLITISNNAEEPIRFRAISCMLLILSQTGLRISELLFLKENDLKTMKLSNGTSTNYILYRTWKCVRGNNVSSLVEIFCNQIAFDAWQKLLEFKETRKLKEATEFIYVDNYTDNPIKQLELPTSANRFMDRMQLFFYTYDKLIPSVALPIEDRKNLSTINYRVKGTRENPKKQLEIVPLTYPTTIQYRVHVCTALYEKGVPLEYIKRYMGHLTREMEGYYVRPKKYKQENVEYSRKVLNNIVTGKTKLLGGESQQLTDRIQKFIEDNPEKVYPNVDEIIDTLLETVPIRQKIGGVCIKGTVIRDCSKDEITNKLYCAYGVCPNLFHFFYNIDVSYRKIKELTQSLNINEKRGLKKQVQKEKNMLASIILHQFLPEFKELKRVIQRDGTEKVKQEYPSIKYIVNNIDSIESEVELWKKIK